MRSVRRDDGFTLIEVLAVIIIIGILAAAVAPTVFQRVGQARQIAAANQIAVFKTALENYRLDVGTYPSTDQGLAALVQRPTGFPEPTGWNGPYLNGQVPLDPWGRRYYYVYPGVRNRGGYDLYTLGSDGVEGGEGERADIVSW